MKKDTKQTTSIALFQERNVRRVWYDDAADTKTLFLNDDPGQLLVYHKQSSATPTTYGSG